MLFDSSPSAAIGYAHEEPGCWQGLARWIDAGLPDASVCFFPAYWAFNIQCREQSERRIDSYAAPKGAVVT